MNVNTHKRGLWLQAVSLDERVEETALHLETGQLTLDDVKKAELLLRELEKRRVTRIMKNEPSRPLECRQKAVLLMAALVLLLLPTAAGVSACQRNAGVSQTQALPAQAPSADIAGEVNRPGGNVTTPKLIRERRPHYGACNIQEKVQGEVLIECVVKADGTVGNKKIIKSLHPDLDQAALDAAAHWVFEPGTREGKPVDVLVSIAMMFTLKPAGNR